MAALSLGQGGVGGGEGTQLVFQCPSLAPRGPRKVSDTLVLLSHCAGDWGTLASLKEMGVMSWGFHAPSSISVYSCDLGIHCLPLAPHPALGIL